MKVRLSATCLKATRFCDIPSGGIFHRDEALYMKADGSGLPAHSKPMHFAIRLVTGTSHIFDPLATCILTDGVFVEQS